MRTHFLFHLISCPEGAGWEEKAMLVAHFIHPTSGVRIVINTYTHNRNQEVQKTIQVKTWYGMTKTVTKFVWESVPIWIGTVDFQGREGLGGTSEEFASEDALETWVNKIILDYRAFANANGYAELPL